jgi:hypothetical protein
MDGRMYLGFVVEKRGRDERPGRHEPILTEAEYHRTMVAIASRRRVGNKPRPFRSYVLPDARLPGPTLTSRPPRGGGLGHDR